MADFTKPDVLGLIERAVNAVDVLSDPQRHADF